MGRNLVKFNFLKNIYFIDIFQNAFENTVKNVECKNDNINTRFIYEKSQISESMGQKIARPNFLLNGNFMDFHIHNDIIAATNNDEKNIGIYSIDGKILGKLKPEEKYGVLWGVFQYEGNIYVTDTTENKVYIFSPVEGRDYWDMECTTINLPEIAGRKISPRGICVVKDEKGTQKIFVCGDIFVFIIDNRGKISYFFPIGKPTIIHMSPNYRKKSVYITSNSEYVNIFSFKGEFIKEILTETFISRGIDVDEITQKIYISSENKEISVVNHRGTELSMWKFEETPRSIRVYKNFLYFCTSNGIFTLKPH